MGDPLKVAFFAFYRIGVVVALAFLNQEPPRVHLQLVLESSGLPVIADEVA